MRIQGVLYGIHWFSGLAVLVAMKKSTTGIRWKSATSTKLRKSRSLGGPALSVYGVHGYG
jgi:hypothetical protein